MYWNVQVLTPPPAEPVTLELAKQHLKVTYTDDDSIISNLIQAAREQCVAKTWTSFVNTQYLLTIDAFPNDFVTNSQSLAPGNAYLYASTNLSTLFPNMAAGTLFLPYSPLVTVDDITYIDTTGTTETADPATDYLVQTGSPGRLTPSWGHVWAFTQGRVGAVQITFTAGYGTDPALVPASIRQAMLLMIEQMYVNRGSEPSEFPQAADALLAPYRVGLYL